MKHPKNVQVRLSDQCSIDLVLVEGGSFLMGDKDDKHDDDKPAYEALVESFYMGKYQVTQAQWQEIMGGNPSRFKGERRPVEMVSWLDVAKFLKKLNGKTEKQFRLPMNEEWEFAARGGIYSEGYLYAGSDKLKQVGWYNANANSETHEVGQLLANELGLYDMSGNVLEWCGDDRLYNYEGTPMDVTVWLNSFARGSRRVLRGGSSFVDAKDCRSTDRYGVEPIDRNNYVGFRLVLPL